MGTENTVRARADEQRRLRARVAATIRRQDGVISLEQARGLGMSTAAVRRRIAMKVWAPMQATVFHAVDHDITPKATIISAMLSIGDHATLVGVSAAWWLRLWDTAPAPVQIAVDPPHQPRARIGVDVRRIPIAADDRFVASGLWVTKKAPTVLEAATRLGLGDGARLMDRALQRERVTLEQLRQVHVRATGRVGSPVARRLLDLAAGGARSEAERMAHTAMRAAGITGWSPNVPIALPGFGEAVGDVVFPAERVILEIDGWAYHRGLREFLRDGPRQSALVAAGWVVLRTHWYELTEDPAAVIRTLLRTLTDRRPGR